ncbi:DUF2591 domain-containing protein [Collimonas pratensis]|uniref:phage protein NinX family protein n=1 Tax=Collimonas pratensis TaxID=279113 RepID=UPI00143DBB38|nr:phage protein NinX family protein [Collimonas pratensis]NKI68891.1 DUF2591 domain-containing protein [Collimonas pratensis]
MTAAEIAKHHAFELEIKPLGLSTSITALKTRRSPTFGGHIVVVVQLRIERMMEINKLSGALLDFWVARSEGDTAEILTDEKGDFCVREHRLESGSVTRGPFEPSSNWMDGGGIIQREGIGIAKLFQSVDGAIEYGKEWAALALDDEIVMEGPDPLTAAMRVFVASKFGESVPDEVK